MPHYPTNYYDSPLGSNYNNVVTRRLSVKDKVAFGQSTRFGGQWLEPKNVPAPYNGTIIDAVGACQQMMSELNLIAPLMPDLGIPVILSSVGVATNVLSAANGVAVSYIGGVTTTVALGALLTFDGVGITTGLRVLYYGLTTSALNGVYTVSGIGNSYIMSRSADLASWWQFVKPKTYVVTGGTNNKANVYSLQSDAWEQGNGFQVALGTSPNTTVAGTGGTSIVMSLTNYSPVLPSGINSTLGAGAGNTSLIYPPYNVNLNQNVGEYDFLSADSMPKFIYLKNRARRLAYWIFKMREQYTPSVSSYGSNIVQAIGLGNSQYNIGVSSLNNLPPQSRYPASFNRGW